MLGHLQVIRAFRLEQASDWSGVTEYLDRARALGRFAGRDPDRRLWPDNREAPARPCAAVGPRAHPPLPRLILAGGLTPENVAAEGRPRPALDGRRRQRRRVHAGPGRKDPSRMAAVRSSTRPGASEPTSA